MQKLVTISLHTSKSSRDSQHGAVHEHLDEYLEEDWRVKSVTPVGTTGGQSRGATAWIAVLLEKRN